MIKYTNEKNLLVLISLLKKHGIKNIVASPGTSNVSFVVSVQNDPFFNLISCVDERSAAYMACGIAAETDEPVVLTCTGATASRNYAPGLTEAYYRKLPIIAITASQHLGRVGQNVAQVLDRSQQFKDLVKKSIQLYEVHTTEDEWACNLAVNDIILESKRRGGGPVHVNMVTTYSNDFSVKELPDERVIERISCVDNLPLIREPEVAVFIGSHKEFSEKLTALIEDFCEKYNGVVLCDHPSKYRGKYRILPNLVTMQPNSINYKKIHFLIDLGEVSGIYADLRPEIVWRVSEDGEIRDTFKKIVKIFEMTEESFFTKMNSLKTGKNTSYYERWRQKTTDLKKKSEAIEIPFSNLWIAKHVSQRIRSGDRVHLSILNTLRSWNMYEISTNSVFYSNTGGFGIDGVLSTALGDSLITNKITYCFIGDLAFFYDMNSIGNRDIKNNLRILLVNNGCGTEFHNFNNRAAALAKEEGLGLEFVAADGHFGNKSKELVKHYAEDLGFEYLSATNKEEFLKELPTFTAEKSKRPILFEVFTNAEDESKALKMIYNLDGGGAKCVAKKVLGKKGKRIVKKLLGK